MPQKPHLWSVNALSRELGKNERTLSKALAGVAPDGKLVGGHDGWFLATAWQALEHYSANSEQLRERSGTSRDAVPSEAALRAVERANGDVVHLLDELRAEPDVEKRRERFRSGGHCLGALYHGLEELLSGDPWRELHAPAIRQAIGSAIGTALDLCQYSLEKPGNGKAAAG